MSMVYSCQNRNRSKTTESQNVTPKYIYIYNIDTFIAMTSKLNCNSLLAHDKGILTRNIQHN